MVRLAIHQKHMSKNIRYSESISFRTEGNGKNIKMSDRIDWSSIIKPFISSNSENIDKNDTFNLVKAIIKRYV